MTNLEAEFRYYLEHQQELAEAYEGRVVVIKDGEVLGNYDNEAAALQSTVLEHKIGTFLIQRVSKDDSETTQTFHSRFQFA